MASGNAKVYGVRVVAITRFFPAVLCLDEDLERAVASPGIVLRHVELHGIEPGSDRLPDNDGDSSCVLSAP